MEALQKAIEKIKEQQSGEKPHSQVRMLGNQLIDMLVKCPDAAEIVLADLEGASMRIQDCAAKLKSYADKIRKEEKRDIVAISPEDEQQWKIWYLYPAHPKSRHKLLCSMQRFGNVKKFWATLLWIFVSR